MTKVLKVVTIPFIWCDGEGDPYTLGITMVMNICILEADGIACSWTHITKKRLTLWGPYHF